LGSHTSTEGQIASKAFRCSRISPRRQSKCWQVSRERLFLQDKPAEAAAVFQRILQREPGFATIRADYAKVLEQLGRKQSALSEFTKALHDDPDLPPAHLGIGRLSADPAAAAEHYRYAARFASTRPEALNNLGNLLASRGDLAAAEEALVSALAATPDLAEAENNLARVFAARRDFAGVMQHLRRALKLDDHYVEARYNLARLLHATGDRTSAIAEYRRVIAADPKLTPAHMSLGVALAESGSLDEAIAEFRETLRLDPHNREASGNLQLALEMKARRN
jgi:tetratricopeptide (TPR) repeat protein